MGLFGASKAKLQELENDLRNSQAENRGLQQEPAEYKPKRKKNNIFGSFIKPTDRTSPVGPVVAETLFSQPLPVPNRSEPHNLAIRSLPASSPSDRPDLAIQITNLSNELRRAQLDIRGKQAKITKLEQKINEEYERPTREGAFWGLGHYLQEPRNSSPVLQRRLVGPPPQESKEQFQSLQRENDSLKRHLQEQHGVFEREKWMEVERARKEAANGDKQHQEELECMRAEFNDRTNKLKVEISSVQAKAEVDRRAYRRESDAQLRAVHQQKDRHIADIMERHQTELQQQRQASEATVAQREDRIAELEREIQEKTARIADTRLVLDRTRNAERQRAIRAAEELAERDRRFEFIQQECARMAAGGR